MFRIASLGQGPERPLSSDELTRRSEDLRSGEVDQKSQHRVIADELGSLNQRLAGLCDRVVLVVAGQPLTVKVPSRAESRR